MFRASSLISSATNMFKTAIGNVDSANQILLDYKTEKENEVEILKSQMSDATKECEIANTSIIKNNELKSKLSQFVV